ncbi:hypothetical protein WME79_31225 [Sorangium sp. So ce726]|uniref:hypothetical protein n=1 Tax=Sorangium sp. So ce726 TaxID=3133319 RepID=UPI003F626FDE
MRAEAVLQAGITYETVKPRIERLRAHHLEAVTTTAFLELLRRIDKHHRFPHRQRGGSPVSQQMAMRAAVRTDT